MRELNTLHVNAEQCERAVQPHHSLLTINYCKQVTPVDIRRALASLMELHWRMT